MASTRPFIDSLTRGKPLSLRWALSVAVAFVVAISLGITQAAAAEKPSPDNAKPSVGLFSPDDGWFDVSQFLDQAYGFLPIIVPITEPAVGYGAFGALVFIDRGTGESKAGFGRPNMSIAGGLGTENGSRGKMAGDIRYWMQDRIQTQVALFDMSINLDYFGTGVEGPRRSSALSYNLSTEGGLARAKLRLGQSPMWVGLGYVRAKTEISPGQPGAFPGLPEVQRSTNVGGLTPVLSYDSRNNFFTPTSGTFVELTPGIYEKSMGSDTRFTRSTLTAIHHWSPRPKWTLGVFANATTTSGDIPFYLRPYLTLRGAPAMRYQGGSVTEAEAEVRWQFWERFSWVGFAGTGVARSKFAGASTDKRITTGGMGMRYEIARKHGLHVGLDVAVGPDSKAVYVQFGSAWMRP